MLKGCAGAREERGLSCWRGCWEGPEKATMPASCFVLLTGYHTLNKHHSSGEHRQGPARMGHVV